MWVCLCGCVYVLQVLRCAGQALAMDPASDSGVAGQPELEMLSVCACLLAQALLTSAPPGSHTHLRRALEALLNSARYTTRLVSIAMVLSSQIH